MVQMKCLYLKCVVFYDEDKDKCMCQVLTSTAIIEMSFREGEWSRTAGTDRQNNENKLLTGSFRKMTHCTCLPHKQIKRETNPFCSILICEITEYISFFIPDQNISLRLNNNMSHFTFYICYKFQL